MLKTQRIIIDTNALMAISELSIDLFSAIELCSDFPYDLSVLQGTIRELEEIFQTQRGKFRVAAKLALHVLGERIKKGVVEVLVEDGVVDDILVKHSRCGDIILTQDVALKKRLKRPYMTIRQRTKVVVVA